MSLYLKYRPQDFENLVWQDFIKNTLKNAIIQNKTVWAYLFCWPRWTWKTSTARIMAKALNCNNLKNWNPCNNCDICNSINNESAIDIIEIDAASHTGVDNIRELIERAQFTPTNTRYKVYIIDEVHMLSKWAFNALLKIIEEPPKYVKFILATTETHKVPETIISRCQRYDFKNIPEDDLKKRLEYIAKKEKIKIDEKSLNYIVKNSAGWLRNAISTFEQLILNQEIKYENLIENLWIVNDEKLKIFFKKLENKDNSIINDFNELINSWKNIKLFFKELIFYIKNKTIETLKNNKDISNYLKILEILDETYSKTKNSLDENTSFIIWILKIINPYSIKSQSVNLHQITSHSISPKNKKINTISWNKKINDKCIYSEINTEEKNNNELQIDDIQDLFWDNSENKEENNIFVIFNKEKFFNKLKESWVKWMIISSLKQSNINLKDNTLNIKFKTNFVKKQFDTTENLEIIKEVLKKMWYQNININLN